MWTTIRGLTLVVAGIVFSGQALAEPGFNWLLVVLGGVSLGLGVAMLLVSGRN